MRLNYFISCIIFVCMLVGAKTSFAQISSYQFEQLDSLQKIENRNVLIFIYTDWCKYCQGMKQTTFKNDSIVSLLNSKYYFIMLDAEEKRTIVYNQTTFNYKPTGINTGTHELAEQLGTLGEKLSFPTLCFLNAKNEIIFQYSDYISFTDLRVILRRLN